MTPKKILNWIRIVESTSYYQRLRYFGVDCWPIIRLTSTSMLCEHELPIVKLRRKSLVSYIKAIALLAISLLRPKETNIVILTNSKFSDVINGTKYYKDASAIIADAEHKGLSGQILFSDLCSESPKTIVCSSVLGISVIASFMSRIITLFLFGNRMSVVDRFVTEELSSLDFKVEALKVMGKSIKRNIVFVIVARYLIIKLLKKTQPNRAYVICYYSNLGLAFCSACKSLGIEVSDIQHGVAGRNMRAYGGWDCVPFRGYNTFPHRFLTWTNYDAEAISAWAEGHHIPVVLTGNLWRSFLVDTCLIDHVAKEWAIFFESVAGYAMCVVLTTQSVRIGALFEKLIAQSPSEICFFIRCHPNLGPSEVSVIEKASKELSKHVYVSEPTAMPIQLLMRKVDFHVTHWSASVYDAYFEKVDSIVVTPEGDEYFDDFIKNKTVFYLKDVGKIIEKLKERGSLV